MKREDIILPPELKEIETIFSEISKLFRKRMKLSYDRYRGL